MNNNSVGGQKSISAKASVILKDPNSYQSLAQQIPLTFAESPYNIYKSSAQGSVSTTERTQYQNHLIRIPAGQQVTSSQSSLTSNGGMVQN